VHGHILMNVSEFLPAYCQRDGHSEYGQSSLFVRLYRSLTSDSESLEARVSSRQDNGRYYPAFRAAVFERPLSKLISW
jgi:hypothetical protein